MRVAPTPQFATPTILPAPLGGINSLDNFMGMSGSDSIFCRNLIPSSRGLEFRKGYVEFAREFSPLVPTQTGKVRSTVPYVGSDPSKDRLFMVDDLGIYDITAGGSNFISPSPTFFSPYTEGSGYCSWVAYTTIADKFLLLCDEAGGAYIYRESVDGWNALSEGVGGLPANQIDTRNGGGSPVSDPRDFVFVTVWKQRVWFVQRDSGTAWYLPIGQVAGAATAVEFGNKFLGGGFLNSIYNATLDGGDGPDDYLVALSSAGDVVAYSGTDPASPSTFNIVGVWQVGRLPVGRQLAATVGGDLYILCAMGVVSLAQLMKGSDPGVLPEYVTAKITPMFRLDVQDLILSRGWSILNYPDEGLLVVLAPDGSDFYTDSRQYVMNTSTRAWTTFSGIPMKCAAVWRGRLYFGTDDLAKFGVVNVYTGYVDGGVLEDVQDGLLISGYLVSAYSEVGAGGRNLRVQFVKPMFVASAEIDYEVSVSYDFALPQYPTALAPVSIAGLVGWGITWGTALWGATPQTPVLDVQGVDGMGKFAAIVLQAQTNGPATLMGFSTVADKGGWL